MRTRPNKPIRRPRRPGIFDDGMVPTLSLNFLSGVLDSRITFTRSTSGTYYSNGFVTTALTDIPRFQTHPVTGAAEGLLIEGAATNLCLRSAAVRTSPWATNALTAAGTSITAPDGTANGVELVSTSGTAIGVGYTFQQVAASASTAYTMSVYLKPKGTNVNTALYIQARASNTSLGYMTVSFFHTSGNMGAVANGPFTSTSATSTNVGNGWYRVTVTGTSPATANNIRFFIVNANLGDGTDGVYAWGAQVEAQSFASSYIPTVASTVARGADSAVISGSAFSGWYNAAAGTLAAYGKRLTTGTFGRLASINDNTANESLDLGGSTTGKWVIRDGGSDVADIMPGTVAANTPFKIAGAYAANDAQAALGGTLGTADTSLALPTVDRLMIGSQAGTPVYLNGTVSQLLYWPTRLPNSTLQSLTT